jgi:DNA replication protein DnaC
MATIETVTKPCAECGEDVQREVPEAGMRFAAIMREMPYVCEGCAQRQTREEAEAEAAREQRATSERVIRWREKSGVPEHLLDFRFSSIDRPRGLERAIEAAMKWAAGQTPGLVLSGTVGVGKTRVAVAAANTMLEYRNVRWFSAPLLISRLGTGEFSNPLRVAALEALQGSMPLVLDDLDKARPTVYAAEALFVAIDQRADGAAPLLVTTNLRLRELADLWPAPFGEAIASRLQLLAGVRVEGPDRRA